MLSAYSFSFCFLNFGPRQAIRLTEKKGREIFDTHMPTTTPYEIAPTTGFRGPGFINSINRWPPLYIHIFFTTYVSLTHYSNKLRKNKHRNFENFETSRLMAISYFCRAKN